MSHPALGWLMCVLAPALLPVHMPDKRYFPFDLAGTNFCLKFGGGFYNKFSLLRLSHRLLGIVRIS